MKIRFVAIALLVIGLSSLPLIAADGVTLGGYLDTGISLPSGWNDSLDYPAITTDMELDLNYQGSSAEMTGSLIFSMDDLLQDRSFADKLSITPGEIYLSLYLDNLDITLGYQRFAWGTADGINPTDNINPKDLSDLNNLASTDVSDLVMPVFAAGVTWYPVDFMAVEGVVLPVFTPPGLPDIASYLPEELSEMTVNFNYPDTALPSFESGVRTIFYLSAMDFSFSYLYAWDDTPDIHVHAGIVESSEYPGVTYGQPDSVDFNFNRVHIFGADFALPVGDIDLRGEAAYVLTSDVEGTDIYVKNPYLHYVVEAGYIFDKITTNLLFSQKIISNFKKISDYDYALTAVNQTSSFYEEGYTINFFPLASDQRGPVMSTLMLVGSISLMNGYLEPSLICIYNFPDDYDDNASGTKLGSLMAAPSVTYQIADAFDIEAGARIFVSLMEDGSGSIVTDDLTPFGMADDLDQFYLKMRYSY